MKEPKPKAPIPKNKVPGASVKCNDPRLTIELRHKEVEDKRKERK